MDNNLQAQQITPSRKSSDIRRAELERKSRNLYEVFNPTNQDHQVILNAAVSPEVWTIPSKSTSVVPWYVAEKYFEEMTQKIITAKSDKAIIEENEKRRAKGFPNMDLHTEQFRFENRNLKNMMGKREQIVKILNRGLYREYGVGGDEVRDTEMRRENKSTFDPGLDITGQPTAPVIPQVVPQVEEIPQVKEKPIKDSVKPAGRPSKQVIEEIPQVKKELVEKPPVVVEEDDE